MMRYKAVVFDMDGTLANTIDDIASSCNEMLAHYKKPPRATDEYRYLVGNGSRKLVERLLPDAAPHVVDEALSLYKGIYDDHLLDRAALYPGVNDLLRELKSRDILLAVCTNKHQTAAERMIGSLFAPGTFDAFTGDREGVPRKPDPSNVHFVLREMGASPKETVYLGDSGVDMKTAVNSGTLPVGVLWGFRERDELIGNGARLLLSHPMELIEKVDFAGKPSHGE